MAFNDKEQEIIRFGMQNGKGRAEIEAAIVRYRTGAPTASQATLPESGGSLAEAGDDLKTGFSEATDAVSQGFATADQAAGEAVDGKISPFSAAAKTIGAGFKAGAGAIGAGVTTVARLLAPQNVEEVVGNTVQAGAEAAVESDPGQYILSKYNELDDEKKALVDGALGTAEGLATLFGAGPAAKVAGDATKRAVEAVGDASMGAMSAITRSTADIADSAGTDLRTRAQAYLGGRNVNPQVQTSAERLSTPGVFLEGTKRTGQPVELYDTYLDQSKKALTDTKVDPAIATVGSEIGDAVKTVVKTRREVGARMATELEKVRETPTDVLPVVDTFVADLKESGLSYDRLDRELKASGQSKLGTADTTVIEKYAQELQGLGSRPTVGDIDAFISRVDSDLALYKSANNITGTTNAERIILKSLSGLREELKTSAGTPYAEARGLYSDLSRFLDNGSSFLGKTTESGDFAKDASLAKSAVQSILNNGKKDWLIELEALTGEPLLDKAVLALQAMKDAGDFRGLSLLQQLSDGNIPTSRAGVLQKIIDFGLTKGVGQVVGPAEDQTRAFLKSLGSPQQ